MTIQWEPNGGSHKFYSVISGEYHKGAMSCPGFGGGYIFVKRSRGRTFQTIKMI
jgi:hypothetical protein